MTGKYLLNTIGTNCLHIRHNSTKGIQYYGFTYYPRFPDKKDPPYQPTKLLMVQRVKSVKGNPYWEKKLLKHFKLDAKMQDIAIVKNIPEVNNLLWKIKHLVKITPITTPNGLPEEGDYNGTWLTEYGEFQVSPRLKVDAKQFEATEEFAKDKTKFDGETLRKFLRLKWISGWS